MEIMFTLRRTGFVAALLLGLGTAAVACNLTQTTLISYTQVGANYVVNAQLCIGAGRTGVTNGADGNTFTFAWGFFRAAGPIGIVSFTPNTSPMLVSTFRACPAPGIDVGPQGPPFNTRATIGYIVDPGTFPSCNLGFTCITNTLSCGNVHSECFNFSFTLNAPPDSARVFGVEGGGNPVAGCYPNPDMLINFLTLPVVWADIDGTSLPQGNRIDWTTLRETNNDHFLVQRSTDGLNFQTIAQVEGHLNSREANSYFYLDQHPPKGSSTYKIVQVDLDGLTSESEVVTLNYTPPSGLAWDFVGPVPTQDHVQLRFLSESDRPMTMQVVDMGGKVVISTAFEARMGSNEVGLDMTHLEPGMYFLRLHSATANLDYKLMRI